MKLAVAVESIEQRWKATDGLPTNVCQTEEPYTEITSSGIHDAGNPLTYMQIFGTEEAAVLAWHQNFMRWALDKRGSLYWRIRPELDRSMFEGKETFRVYSRVAISAKEVRYPTLEDLERAREEKQQPASFDMVPVKSTNIKAIGYRAEDRMMCVEFHGGEPYTYLDVPADVHAALMASESKGKYFDAHFRKAKGRRAFGFVKARGTKAA